MRVVTTFASLMAACLVGTSPGVAQPQQQTTIDANEHGPAQTASAARAFLPWGAAPTLGRTRASVYLDVGYDTQRSESATARGEVALWGPGLSRSARVGVAVIAGAGYARADADVNGRYSGLLGLQVQPLFQQRAGVDLAVSSAYTTRGFSLLPALVTELMLARRTGAVQLLLNLAYGQSVRDADRFGSVRVAALLDLVRQLRIGFDGKVTTDLERDLDEPTNEAQLDARAGPVLSYALANVVLGLRAGIGLISYRLEPGLRVGTSIGFSAGSAM